ncbi:hypothetical protein GNY06_02365 [Elizabethkingia argentiflava]|uniref:HTH cro/C1-type domain-containing protein n=1 Tax=Elizabethkingia argenteiflava TaxID=2681556 RepID=A0A845PTN2_9FLAO|nr:hypothetical protein [Elizabethkingia argenteiflava]NAW50276.1 hypothetical protein [Elizabethkingia argenteiflava]
MDNILAAIIKISEQENITITKLEHLLGASKGVFSRAISHGSDIQSKWVLKLVEKFPDYSAEWILTGKGDMYKDLKGQVLETKSERENTLIAQEKMEEVLKSLSILQQKLDNLELDQKESNKAQSIVNEIILENIGIIKPNIKKAKS